MDFDLLVRLEATVSRFLRKKGVGEVSPATSVHHAAELLVTPWGCWGDENLGRRAARGGSGGSGIRGAGRGRGFSVGKRKWHSGLERI